MTPNTELSDVIPNLWPAIFWLEGGCNPREVAKELRIYAERIDAARKLAASPAPLREADEGSGINDLMQRVIRHLQAQADYTPSLSNHKALLRTISEVRAFAAIKPNGLRARPCHKYGADPGCKCGAICAIDAEQGRVLRASGIEADGDGGKGPELPGFLRRRMEQAIRTGEIMSYYRWDYPETKLSELVGKTLKEVHGAVGDDKLGFVCEDGSVYVMWHSQDCCESVSVESIVGDLADLIGSPILLAEESTSDTDPPGVTHEYAPESQTWTFYKLATIKGYVDIRWHGESNGYYSESVDFARISGPAPEASDGAA
jgi:hypothetical protein